MKKGERNNRFVLIDNAKSHYALFVDRKRIVTFFCDEPVSEEMIEDIRLNHHKFTPEPEAA